MRALTKSMVLSVVMAVVALPLAASEAPESGKDGPFGLDKVIAFYAGLGVESQTFIGGDAWKDWKERGSVVYRGMTTGFLSENVEEGSDVLANLDFRDNPNPVVCIDEFGWDYDGGKDRHTAAILQAVHRKRPRLKIAVYQMRGPVAPELAAAYRDTVELVMLETYVDLNDAWLIGFQLQAARLTGLLDRSVLALGLGAEAEDASRGLHGWEWVRTAKELDQQVRLIRMVARESPGLAFFGKFLTGERAMRMTDEELEAICSRFDEYPTDGTGLRPELLKLGKMFTKRYEGPAVFCSSEFVLPHWTYEGTPYADAPMRVTRVLMMNLGEKDAKGIKVRLRGPWEGSEVWAEGPVDIPARSLVVALLPLLPGKSYRGWLGTEIMEVDAPPGCEVFNFKDSRYHGKRESEATEEAKATKADAESAAPERPTPSMAALPTPLPEERAEAGTSPPEEWTSEKRTVTVATPDGKQEKEITYHRNTIGMEFVRIPAGEFMMGSPPGEADRDDDEGPQHRVRIAKPFYMGAHEVTQAEYEKLMGENPATFEGANNPVEEVSW
ncbi:MAG: SUMF1/EgtB/PvdO family nonheme iron enzyme, partial [Candidatus Brocadiia bacterium]|nr:SUMF1/EgtB/PvdO family nonheme iron enzyme [Candidatus Brocadiia bacterium]